MSHGSSGRRFDTVAELGRQLRAGAVSAVELAEEAPGRLGTIEDVAFPQLPFDAAAHIVIAAEAASAFEEFITGGGSAGQVAPEEQVGLIDAPAMPATNYLRALRVRRRGMAELGTLLAPFDALIAPAYPREASPLWQRFSEEPKDPSERTIGGAANLCGLPGLALPVGLGREGSPVAVTLTGKVDGDAALLAVGIAFQAHTMARAAARDRTRPAQ